jgi:hypothetical protein
MSHTARLICDAYWADGTPLRAAPRYVLRKLVEDAGILGLQEALRHERNRAVDNGCDSDGASAMLYRYQSAPMLCTRHHG